MSDAQPLSAGTDVRAAVEAGEAAATPFQMTVPDEMGDESALYLSTVPWGGEQVVFDPEPYEDVPRRRRGVVRAQTVNSLVAYTLRHIGTPGDDNTVTTWVDVDGYEVTSVLNDHSQSGAGWGDHRVRLSLGKTPEWEHWMALDGKLVEQEAFATHIEDGVRELITPDAATMLEIAQTFTAHTDAQFRQATRLQSGQVQFRYDEETTARAGTSGDMDVPSTFTLAIAPFLDEPAYEVTARLRYRVSGGKLRIGYKLDRPERVLRDAIENITGRLAADLPTPVFIGRPR